ncbi:anti-repressor SinI family protein [Mesobacillus foraminis]|nr:anti-repressor SinI family protein [Mesobacillus foraminis]
MNNLVERKKETELDKEWIELIKEALNLGLSVNQIREFLNYK